MSNIKAVVRNRNLVAIGLSESISGLGNWITMMAVLAWIVFRGQGSVIQSSLIFLAGLVPALLFSPVAGWLVDRYDRKKIMIASELLSGAVISVLIFTENMIVIYVILALQAVFVSMMAPARQVVLPEIVKSEDLHKANAFLQQLAGMIKIGAPVFAGIALAVLSPHTAIILDVVSFLFSALILTRLPSLPPQRYKERDHQTELDDQQFPNLWRTIRALPGLKVLFLSIYFSIVTIIGFDVLAPVFTRDILDGNESFFGLAVGSVGLGTFLISILLILQKRVTKLWLNLAAGIFLLAAIPVTLTLAAQFPGLSVIKMVVLFGCLIGGIGSGLIHIQSITLIQLYSPPNMLGRISGLFQSVTVAGQLTGILLTPLVVPSLLSLAMFFGLSSLLLFCLAGTIAFQYRYIKMPITKERNDLSLA